MPFYDENPALHDLTNIAVDDPEPSPSLLQTFGAAFRTQNTIGSALSSMGMLSGAGEVDADFNPIDYVKDDPKYAPFVEQFAGITNKRTADAKKLQIDREQQDNRTLAAAGWTGVVAQMAAGVVDLPTLLPAAGGLIGGGSRAARIAGTAIGAGVDAGISEAALQATQATRTPEETALNIGGSIVLGGALGTLVSRYLDSASTRALSAKIEAQEGEFAKADQEFANLGKGSSAGAAASETGPLKLKDEGFIAKLPLVNRQDPLIRLQLSDLDASREAVRRAAETPLEYADNAAGVATETGGAVETRMKMWHAPLATSLREIDTIYARYYHGTPEPTAFQRFLSPALSEFDRWRGSNDRLTYKQFKEQVGIAAYSGEQHAIPQVEEAAKVYRRIDDAMKQAAIDAGIFSPDVAVKGDISHLFRMYNKEKIIARRDQFRRILSEHFQSAQQAAGFKAAEIRLGNRITESDRALENHDRLTARVQNLEDRLAERSGSRQRRTDALTQLRQDRIDTLKTRAPAQLVQMLRGADENAAMVDAVKQSRAAARSANRKQSFAEKTPVLAIIKRKGGVRVGSKLDSELRAMDVTPKTHPGLFVKNGGIGDVDNFVKSEDSIFADLPDDGAGYVDPVDVMETIRSELGGNPLRTAEEQAAEAAMDSIDKTATEWLHQVGLPENASVKDVRDFIDRVQRAESNTYGLDARISRFEKEIEDFDAATEAIINERDISKTELKGASEHLQKLEDEISQSADLAKSSPRVALIVDYAKAKRDLYKAKLSERTLSKRVEALQRMEDEGRANDTMLSELTAKLVDLDRVRKTIDGLKVKADKLEPMVLSKADLEKADEFANLLPGEVDKLADETINNILGHSDSRIPYDIVSGPRGALKERLLNIESGKIQDFLNTDIEEVLRSQVRTMSADVELARKFGSVDMAEQIRKINDEADAKIAAAESDQARKSIETRRNADIRDISAIRDRLRGQYALPSNPDSLVLRAARVARNINYLRLLGGMTVSAIPDLAKVVFAHGLTSTFRDGFLPMVRNFKAFRLAAQEVKEAGTALDMVLDSRAMAMADITDDFGRHSAFERGLTSLTTRFGVISLMGPWNAALKQFSGLVTMTNILKSAERVAAGTGTSKDIRNLASSGIDAGMAKRIWQQFAGGEETVAGDLIPNANPAIREFEKKTVAVGGHGEIQDGIYLPHGANWTDQGALEAFRAAVVREVDRMIVTPGQDKPLWMSTELGKMVGQFKSFGVSSMQKTMLAGLQQRDAATLNGVMLSLGLGAMTYWARETIAGREISDDPSVWATNALDWSGLTGWAMDANGIVEKATRGHVGLSAFTGQPISRYQSRNVTGAFLGPTADAVSDIFQISGSVFAGDTTKSDLHKLRQLLPAQNLFYIRSLLNRVEAATGDALDLPDTQKAK